MPLVAISDDGKTLQPAYIENFPCYDFHWVFSYSHSTTVTSVVMRKRILLQKRVLNVGKNSLDSKNQAGCFSESYYVMSSSKVPQTMTYTQVTQEEFLSLTYANIPQVNGKPSYSPLESLRESCGRFFGDCEKLDQDRL